MTSNEVSVQQTNTGQFLITIPRAIAGSKGWIKGTKLKFVEDRFGDVTLKEVKD